MIRLKNRFFILLVLAASSLTAKSALAQDQIYFLTGNPVKKQAAVVLDAIDQLRIWVELNLPAAKFTVRHNSQWKQVCLQILYERKVGHGPERVILIGHSFGVQAGIDLAHCLRPAQVAIAGLISIDPVHIWLHPDVTVVPENIEAVKSYFQNQDHFIWGRQNLHRADGSSRGIVNQRVEVPAAWFPHPAILGELVESQVLQRALGEVYFTPTDASL